MNIKWFLIEEQIGCSLAILRFQSIYNETVPNSLRLMQKVVSTLNLRFFIILIDANQQLKTFEKQAGNIFNKLPANIQSVKTLSVFKAKAKNHFPDQALARNYKG